MQTHSSQHGQHDDALGEKREVDSAGRSTSLCSHTEAPAFGFTEDGCISRRAEVHRSYTDGLLTEEQYWLIDEHLLACKACCNVWDALSIEMMEETLPCEVHVAEEASEMDEPEEIEA